MATLVVSFRSLSRDRYQPWVWRGQFETVPILNWWDKKPSGQLRKRKVWQKFKPIKKSQLDAFRNRMNPTRRPAREMLRPQRVHKWRGLLSNKLHREVYCKCGTTLNVPQDALRVTCSKCNAITPILRG